MKPIYDPTVDIEGNTRAGLLFVLAAILVLPLVLAYLFGACALMLAAWDLMLAQIR